MHLIRLTRTLILLVLGCTQTVYVLATTDKGSDSGANRVVYWIDDFENPTALRHWHFSNGREFPGADGTLSIGVGHIGRGAVLHFSFTCQDRTHCGRYVAAYWKPPVPIAIQPRSRAIMLDLLQGAAFPPQPRLRADRRLRYASSPIRTIVPVQRTGEQHQDIPMSPDVLLPISPAGHLAVN